MQLQKLSFADMMAKYVENPALPTFTGSNSINLVENYAISTIKKTNIMTCEPSYTSYTNVVDTPSKSTNWLKFIIWLIIFGVFGWFIYHYRESIRKWYVEHYKNYKEEDRLNLNN
ncbi:hypothetical protein [Emticicia sp.]|uniref:hypothetical protein n=1 Tax=Emticicia sp. TaxID=1930953 RepID=UPI003752A164